MKKFFSLLLTLCLLLSLTACGGNDAPATENDQAQINTNSPTGPMTGSGTAEAPYCIASADHLFEMAEKINNGSYGGPEACANYVITQDIDVGGKAFTPIGYFKGILDGGGHTISGLNIKSTDEYNIGLFSKIDSGIVKNLTISDSTFSGTEHSHNVAAIAAECAKGIIENCHITDSVTIYSEFYAAGICVNYHGAKPISGCTNAATITSDKASSSAAGIVVTCETPIVNCTNTGIISAVSRAAGIVTRTYSDISNCINNGTVTGADHAAGIVSYFDKDVIIEDCSNSGTISASNKISSAAGGIAGECCAGTIKNCTNDGEVKSSDAAGGIIGAFKEDETSSQFTVSNCINNGSITSDTSSGKGVTAGIIAKIISKDTTSFLIEGCTNNGKILTSGLKDTMREKSPAGGIIGIAEVSTLSVSDCSNNGEVNGFFSSGGIIGILNANDNANVALQIKNSPNAGSIHVKFPGGNIKDIFVAGILGVCQNIASDDVSFEGSTNTGTLTGEEDFAELYTNDLCNTSAN